MDEIRAWLVGRLPDGWFDGAPEVSVDRDEIVVVGTIPAPATEGSADERRAAEAGRIGRFREETRGERMRIADEAERRFGRKVAWGARCGETRQVFTSLAVPAMTRLRQPERLVLDTLVDAGIARSRSEALAWCVRLVGQHQADWIAQLRDALVAVREAAAAGPTA
ncbi:MAG TPA: hypothetical protein VGD03_12920 [Frankiaceae bacterium]|jgi:hypothetical protein